MGLVFCVCVKLLLFTFNLVANELFVSGSHRAACLASRRHQPEKAASTRATYSYSRLSPPGKCYSQLSEITSTW